MIGCTAGRVVMFFKKRPAAICVVCGKTIEPTESRFVEKNRATKAERHTHINCSNLERTPSGHDSARSKSSPSGRFLGCCSTLRDQPGALSPHGPRTPRWGNR
jgi:hypothetical protein